MKDKEYTACIFKLHFVKHCPVREEISERIGIKKKMAAIASKKRSTGMGEDMAEIMGDVETSLTSELSDLARFCAICPTLKKVKEG